MRFFLLLGHGQPGDVGLVCDGKSARCPPGEFHARGRLPAPRAAACARQTAAMIDGCCDAEAAARVSASANYVSIKTSSKPVKIICLSHKSWIASLC
mgnify:CR=1 FL=1